MSESLGEPTPELFTRPDGLVVFTCPAAGPPLRTEQDALDIIGTAVYGHADIAVIPAARVDPSMFDLSTRSLGQFLQKFVNYRLPVAFVGDISAHVARSGPLRDFVAESNRGRQVWFLADDNELAGRLDRLSGGSA